MKRRNTDVTKEDSEEEEEDAESSDEDEEKVGSSMETQPPATKITKIRTNETNKTKKLKITKREEEEDSEEEEDLVSEDSEKDSEEDDAESSDEDEEKADSSMETQPPVVKVGKENEEEEIRLTTTEITNAHPNKSEEEEGSKPRVIKKAKVEVSNDGDNEKKTQPLIAKAAKSHSRKSKGTKKNVQGSEGEKKKVMYVPVINAEDERAEKWKGVDVKFMVMPQMPKSAYIFYTKKRLQEIFDEDKTQSISLYKARGIIADEWRKMDVQDKREWILMSQDDRIRYYREVIQKAQKIGKGQTRPELVPRKT